jgi:hypothetical protein
MTTCISELLDHAETGVEAQFTRTASFEGPVVRDVEACGAGATDGGRRSARIKIGHGRTSGVEHE